jgi:hypothetical protein
MLKGKQLSTLRSSADEGNSINSGSDGNGAAVAGVRAMAAAVVVAKEMANSKQTVKAEEKINN